MAWPLLLIPSTPTAEPLHRICFPSRPPAPGLSSGTLLSVAGLINVTPSSHSVWAGANMHTHSFWVPRKHPCTSPLMNGTMEEATGESPLLFSKGHEKPRYLKWTLWGPDALLLIMFMCLNLISSKYRNANANSVLSPFCLQPSNLYLIFQR